MRSYVSNDYQKRHGNKPPLLAKLKTRLKNANIGLAEPWAGTNAKNRFLCHTCESTWTEFGYCITSHNKQCPVCVPRNGSSRQLNIRLKDGTPWHRKMAKLSDKHLERMKNANIGLAEPWAGANAKNRFLCYICKSTWTEFGRSVTLDNNQCPVCHPRQGKGLRLNIQIKQEASPIG